MKEIIEGQLVDTEWMEAEVLMSLQPCSCGLAKPTCGRAARLKISSSIVRTGETVDRASERRGRR